MNLDVVCLSHIRWEKQAQRPQELLRRYAKEARVFYIEDPVYTNGLPELSIQQEEYLVWRVIPTLPDRLSPLERKQIQGQLLEQLLEVQSIGDYILLYYNPAGLGFTQNLRPCLTIYDCITRFQPKDGEVFTFETELLKSADIVLNDSQKSCDNQPLYKGSQRLFPGSINLDHFFTARGPLRDPVDQSHIPHPRLGFWGVINQSFDAQLIEAVAHTRPDWHFVLLGPITCDPEPLLHKRNIHYLSTREYPELPAYLSGWDAAILPLAGGEPGVRYSVSQIPQYLAGGCPVVSTSIPAVLRSFARWGLTDCADTPEHFIQAVEKAISGKKNSPSWLEYVDEHLADGAWDLSWEWFEQSIQVAYSRRYAITSPVDMPISSH